MTITMYVPCEVIAERWPEEIDTNSDAGIADTTSWLRVASAGAVAERKDKKTGGKAVAIS